MQPKFPLHVSPNGRYLMDNSGRPFFYHGDSAWRMPQRLSLSGVARYLDDRKGRSFTAIQLHGINKELEGEMNIHGDAPFLPSDDITKPNEPYWRHLDAILTLIREKGFLAVVSASWFGGGGAGWRKHINLPASNQYGSFLGHRYSGFDNIIWILGGDNNPGNKADVVCAMAAALKKAAPHHLITYHPDPGYSSAKVFRDVSWLDINMVYTVEPAYKLVAGEYSENPIRPVLLGETGFEGDSWTGFIWTPGMMRRQAYWAILCGACGHAMGCKGIWDFAEGWEGMLGKESILHMDYLLRLFSSIQWWKLIPDFGNKFLVSGCRSFGGVEDAVAAIADDMSFAIAYVPALRELLLDISSIDEKPIARWYDPTDGSFQNALFSRSGEYWHVRPATRNAKGEFDWILIVERSSEA